MSDPKELETNSVDDIYEFQEGDFCEEGLDQLELVELLDELDYPYLEAY